MMLSIGRLPSVRWVSTAKSGALASQQEPSSVNASRLALFGDHDSLAARLCGITTGGDCANVGGARRQMPPSLHMYANLLVPGPGPAGKNNSPTAVGDNPNLPRDPDKFDGTVDAQREFRERGVPSGLANEIFLDVYERLASFEPHEMRLERRLFEAYEEEVERVDPSHHGIITATVGDIDTPTDGFPNNERLYLPPTVFNRFAVTREINDGLLAPRFSPSQRAWVLSGVRVPVTPAVSASAGRDADDR